MLHVRMLFGGDDRDMDLRVEKVANSKRKQEVKNIYTTSFPKEDRMPFGMMLMMSYLWNTEFLSFYDRDTLCGFVYMATIRKLTFVMFFSVAENLRSKGYGSRILDEIQSIHANNKIIVSIEPCNQDADDIEQRLRRKKFYTNNGYEETGYCIKLGGKKQEIIIKNGAFDKREFMLFLMLYSNFTLIPKIRKC